MSAIAPAPRSVKSPNISFNAWDFWAFALPILAMLPMLVFQWQNLMSRPERQFFPALVIVALFFPLRALWGRPAGSAPAVPRVRLCVAVAALQLALLCYGLSVWGFSPWLAHLAAIWLYFGWALGRCTDSPWSSVLAWTGLLLITLPLPLNYDARLISWLQASSSWATSMSLDALQVPHLRLANVIEMRDRQFFIEEACSGIGSMYALLAAAALLLLVNRRSLLVAALTLASVPVWAMLGNFLRLLTITLGHHYYQRDLSHGWDHELLGVATFATAAFGLWMTEWMLADILRPIPPAAREFAFLIHSLNTLLSWPSRNPFVQGSARKYGTSRARVQPAAEGAALPTASRGVQPWDTRPIRWWLRGGALATVLLGIAPTVVLARGSAADMLEFGLPEFTAEALRKFPDRNAMPERLRSWQRIGFRTEQRSSASLFGAHSLIWEYARGEERILLSLDFPFRGAHPLELCYAGAGWSIDAVEPMAASDAKQWEWREVSMSNEFGAKALVYYAALTEDGQTYAVSQAEEVGGRFNRTLAQVFLSREPAYQPVCYQVQVLYEGGTQLSDAERAELRESFLDARTQLLAQIRKLP